MIDPAGRVHNLASTQAIVSAGSRSQTSQSQSFAAELSDRLASTIKSKSEAARLPASLPAGQQIVTWRDPSPVAGSGSASPSGTTPQPSGENGLVITFPDTTSAGASKTAANTEASSPPMTFDQAYWAAQPAAVQQLQNIQNPTARAQLGEQLAQQGYSIDVPIMVWGWDPATTTAARESMGYTWVPSAEQQPVEVAPGLTFGGTSYNSANPPAGSITV
jgi:hypothetical protein